MTKLLEYLKIISNSEKTKGIICGAEEGFQPVEHDKKAFVDCARAKVTEILKRATPPSDNLILSEKRQ